MIAKQDRDRDRDRTSPGGGGMILDRAQFYGVELVFADDEPVKKRQKMSAVVGVASNFTPADISDIVQSATCFRGKEICVLNGQGKMSKHQLEKIIASAEGVPVQHPGNSF